MAIIGAIAVILLVAAMTGLILGVWLLPVALVLLGVLFVVLCFAFWIWMLIDCIKNENIGGNEKVAWVIAIALTHCLGAVIYFFAGRTRRPAVNVRPMV